MENKTEFNPNIEYNRKRRNKYFAMFAIFVVLVALMDAWFITTQFFFGLFLNAFLILFIVLTPKTLKENPTKNFPVLTVSDKEIIIMDKRYDRSAVRSVKAIVYLGSVGNMVENRDFLEKCAADVPPENMMGQIEIVFETGANKVTSEFATIENIVEALSLFIKEGKVTYKLGYSLGKEYRTSTYNLKEIVKEKPVQAANEKNKFKQII